MGEVASVSAAREPAGWQYDLFVTYAEADREWVHGYLVPALGLPPERLQTPEDFRPGAPVVVEFGRAIAESRFTAVILSSAYLADDWAVFGEQLASHAGAAERRDTVIPVLRSREPVPLRVGFRVPIDCTDQRRWEQQVARLRDLLGRSEPAPETLPCPYPGMVPFQGDNARFFYGREAEVEDLVRRLRHQHFLMVIGPSGSGKSSLVFAGVLPRLAERHGRDWLVRSMRPGGKPLQALLAVLEGRVAVTTDEGWRHLLDGLLRVRSHAGRVLLVVDQLEEIFTQAPPDTRAGFLSAVRALAQHESCVLVLTMRADFYPDLMTSDLWPLPGERAEVAPLRGAALKRAVEQPAARVGVHLEPGLLERLLADAANEPGVLPLVQETMVLLWEQRQRRLLTQSAYDALGTDGQSGVAVALATKAEATLSTLTPVEQAIARRIFRRLVQLGEGRDDTRRQQPVSALRGREEPSSFDHVLHHLTNHRLLTVSGDERGEERRVDLSHEALIGAWPTLRRWVSEDRDGLRIQQELSEDARGWVKLDRDPGALYRGARLATAREWADTRADELNPLEREFLEGSRAREVDEIEEAHRRADEQARSARRLRVVVAGLALFLVIASVSTVLAVRASNNARAAEIDATSRGLAAQATADTENLPRSLLASLEALRVKDTPEARGALLASLERSPGATRVLTGGAQAQVQSLALSRNGEIVAAAGDDKVIRLWSVRTGQPVRAPLTGHRAPVSSIAFSPDGLALASGGEDGTVRLWNLNTGTQALLWAHDPGEVRVAFDPTGKRLASAGKDKLVRLWDPRTAEPLGKPMRGHIGPVTAVAFSADGRTLASGSADHDIRLWELRPSPRLRQRLKGHSNEVTSVAFSPDGTTLASGAYDETLRIWDVRSGTQLREPLQGHNSDVISVAFSPDGTTLASGSEDETVRLWDTEDWMPRGVLSGHSGTVTSVAFGRNRATLASGGHDGTVILWNLRSVSRLGERLRGHRRHANSAAFSPDGGAIAASGADGKVWLWNLPARRLQGGPLQGHHGTVTSVAFSPDGALLVTCAHDGAVRLWDARTGEPRGRPMSGHAGMVETVAFSRDGRLIASGGQDGTVRLWDVATQQPVGEAMTGHQGTVRAVAFAPDGATLASGGDDKTLRFWDVERQQQLGKALPFRGSVASLAFNRDGTMLALGLWEVSHVVLWDVRQRRPWSEPLAGSLHGVNAVAFSPDGKTLASGSRDRTVRLWSVESQETPRPLGEPLTGHEASVQGLAFSPGGEMLVSAGEDGMVMLWDMRIDSWKRKACTLANRNLSRTEWDHLLPRQDYRRTCPEFPPGPEAPPGP